MNHRWTLTAVAGLLLAVGCTGKTARVEVGKELVSDPTSISIQDFETIAQQMTRDMIKLPQIQNASSPPTIAFLEVQNRSNDFVDKNAFLENMRTLLIQNAGGKMVFLDRENYDKLRDEASAKQAGDLTSSGNGGQMYGADYFLTGVISSINAEGGSERSIYRRYAFRLTNTRGAIIWEKDYKTQIYARRSAIYR